MSDWIESSKQLPEQRQEVFFYVRSEPDIYVGWFETDHWDDTTAGHFHRYEQSPMAYPIEKATHWQPLYYPEVPRR